MIKIEDRAKGDSYRKKKESCIFFPLLLRSNIFVYCPHYARRCESVSVSCALAIEKTLLECHPGHGQDEDRRETDHGSISPTFYEQLFTGIYPKSTKKDSQVMSHIALLGSTRVKAVRKLAVAIDPKISVCVCNYG